MFTQLSINCFPYIAYGPTTDIITLAFDVTRSNVFSLNESTSNKSILYFFDIGSNFSILLPEIAHFIDFESLYLQLMMCLYYS